MPLPRSKYHMPLVTGLNTKPDPRALAAPELEQAQNVEFDRLGGINKRLPYATVTSSVVGGGTIAGTRRKVVTNGDELLLFTTSNLYSWSERDVAWVDKGEYLAPMVEEQTVLARTDEQVLVCRAQLNGVEVYAWDADGVGVYVGARDEVTGTVLQAPTLRGLGGTSPRLVALTTRVLLLFIDQAGILKALSIDPGNLATTVGAVPTTIIAAATFGELYDVCRSVANPANAIVVSRRDTTTSYDITRIPETITGFATTTKARSSINGMGVAVAPSGDRLAVIRNTTAGDVHADVLVESTFVDSTVNVVLQSGVGGSVTRIACAFRSVQDSGTFRCYAFWSRNRSSVSGFNMHSNYVTAAGGAGSVAVLARSVDPVSRAFDHGGKVFLWTGWAQFASGSSGFRSQQQNTFYLYRDDGVLVTKSLTQRAGGMHADATGFLSSVQNLSANRYAWGASERKRIPVGKRSDGFSAQTPASVVFSFDAQEARRCVRLGRTLYVTGGMLLQYDGEGLTEVGFNVYPYRYSASASGAGSGLVAGTYGLKWSFRWDNAVGERERSTSAVVETVTTTAGQELSSTPDDGATVTQKLVNFFSSRSAVALEAWRTAVNPTDTSPFFLTTDGNPANSTGDNRYVANTDSSYTLVDVLSDDDLREREAHPENVGVLENTVPPGCSIVAATQDRLFLAGIPGRPYQVVYSRLRNVGEVASFNDGLSFEVPPEGGVITGLAFLSETLVVLCERSVWAMPGVGLSNIGDGQNYGPAQLLCADCGAVNQDSVVFTPVGLLFKSLKGWYLLSGASAPVYVGGNVSRFDSDEVVAAHVFESKQQVRILTDERIIVWDYNARAWFEWTITGGVSATLWQGSHVLVANNGAGLRVMQQSDTYDGSEFYSMLIETAWIKDGLQDFARIYRILILGEYRDIHRLRVQLARNYDTSGTDADPVFFEDRTWTPNTSTVGSREQVRVPPSIQKCQAIKIRISDVELVEGSGELGESVRLTGIGFEVGLKNGMFKLGTAQTQG